MPVEFLSDEPVAAYARFAPVSVYVEWDQVEGAPPSTGSASPIRAAGRRS